MECFCRVQPPGPDPRRFEALHDGFNFVDRPADHLVGPVVRRNVHPDSGRHCIRCPDFGCYLWRRRKNRGHGARFGCGQQGAPRAGKAHAVFQAEYSRRVRRRQFPHTVPHHHPGPYAHTGPERRQRAFQREQCRLFPGRIAQFPFRPGTAEHDVQQGGSPFIPEYCLTVLQDRLRHRFVLVQRLPHAGPLASLAGVDERDLVHRPGLGHLAGFGQFPEPFLQGSGIVESNTCAVFEMAASRARSPRHVRQQGFRHGAVPPHLSCHLPGLFTEP